jgi:hypothetical protein
MHLAEAVLEHDKFIGGSIQYKKLWASKVMCNGCKVKNYLWPVRISGFSFQPIAIFNAAHPDLQGHMRLFHLQFLLAKKRQALSV